MSSLVEQLESSITQVNADSELLHEIVHGGDTTVVTTEGGPVNSLAKAVKDLGDASGFAKVALGNVPAGTITRSLLQAACIDLSALAADVVAVLGASLDPTELQGTITATADAIIVATGNAGKWYSIAVTGTLSGTNAPAIAVGFGDRIVSDGTAWIRYAAPPTSIPDLSVVSQKLGTAAVVSRTIRDASLTLRALADELKSAVALPYNSAQGIACGFLTPSGKVILGASNDGKLCFGGQRYGPNDFYVDAPDTESDFTWGVLQPTTPADGTYQVILAVKADGSLWTGSGRVGGDLLLQSSGTGYEENTVSQERCNITESADAFLFYVKKSALWIPWRCGKSGNGNRARYIPADLNGIFLYGQSNATRAGNEGGTNNALTTTAHARNLMFNNYTAGATNDEMLAPQNSSDSSTYVAGGLVTSFQALKERSGTDVGETFNSGLANTITARLGWKMFAGGAAVGGYSVTQLVKGTFPYTNLMYQITRAKEIAQALGMTFKVAAIPYIQGEADAADSSWHTKVLAVFNDIDADVKAITGQLEDVIFIVEQMNRPIWTTAQPVDLSILLANHGSSGRVYVQSPRYQFVMSNHYYPHGKRARGCSIGETLVDILGSHAEFEAVRPKSYSVSGNDLLIRFHVPVAPLQFSTNDNQLTLLTNYGFDIAGGLSTISAVSLVHDDLVKLTVSGGWSGKTLRYARQDGLAAEKGNLCDSCAKVPIYNDAGGSPYSLKNWSLAFEIAIP